MPVRARNIVAEIRRRGGTNRHKGMEETARWMCESLAQGHLAPEEYSIRETARAFLGDSFIEAVAPNSGKDTSELVRLMESAGDGVSHSAFTNVNRQIIYSRVMESFNHEAFTATRLIPTIPTVFEKEVIPGATRTGDVSDAVGEGMPYPEAGFGEDYIETPKTVKRGHIVGVTREAIFFDRTGLILQRAREVGEWLGVNREKRALRTLLGIDNTYTWLGTTYNTYQSTQWTNTQTNELVDWTDVEASELLFVEMTDPHTGEPIVLIPNSIFVMPSKVYTARMILNATQIRQTTGSTIETLSDNPVRSQYTAYTSRWAKSVLVDSGVAEGDADTYWFHGDFSKAFAYMQNWPLQVTTQRSDSESSFTRDIVQRFKCSERGTYAVMEPRAVVRNKNSS